VLGCAGLKCGDWNRCFLDLRLIFTAFHMVHPSTPKNQKSKNPRIEELSDRSFNFLTVISIRFLFYKLPLG